MKIASNSTFSPVNRAVADAARRFLARPFRLLSLSTVILGIGLYFAWSWLAAAGVLPILLPALLCVGMCMLGICMDMASDAPSQQPLMTGKVSSPEGEMATGSGVSAVSDDATDRPSETCARGEAPLPGRPVDTQMLLPSWLKRPNQRGQNEEDGSQGSA
jgi:hypothetical protein